MKLREYQEYGRDAIFDYFEQGVNEPTLVCMPTGTGKSPTIGDFIRKAFSLWPGLKILVATHSKKIISQNHKTLLRLWPTAPAGIYSAGLSRKDTRHAVIYGGIQSMTKAPLYFGHVDILIIDEAHLVSDKESTGYRTFIEELKKVNPNLAVIGFTATKYRMGQGLLTDGDNRLFTNICCDMTSMEAFNWFFDEGYLCRLRPVKTDAEYDVSGVRTVQGDYHQGDLQKAVDKAPLTEKVVKEAIRLAELNGGRNHWLVFASGVAHTIHVAEELNRQGIHTTYIHANTKDFKMSDDEADQRLADFEAGKYQAIVSNGILTTGFDDPNVDYIVMTRKTKSPSLWVQMLGRGTRPVFMGGFDLSTKEGRLNAISASDKPYCLVADFAGNAKELGPINDPRIPKAKGKKEVGDAPIRICDNCGTYNWAGATSCDFCGTLFPRVLQLQVKAATDELIKVPEPPKPPKVEIFKVDRVEYYPHFKEGKPPSIRVMYYCGLRRFPEWIGLEHPGSMGTRSRNWWKERANDEPPDTTIDALKDVDSLRVPKNIHVRTDSQHPEIMKYEY